MGPDYWLQRWKDGRIGFHQGAVDPCLVQHQSVFAESIRVLVPLCGKSVDLEWLVVEGYEVVGVELSEIAARAFFAERGFTPERSEEEPFVRYRYGNVTIYVGDFFAVTADRIGSFDGVYDCAAMIALPADDRERYRARLRTLLTPKAKLLLLTLHHDAPGGPPFSVSPAEVAAGYPDARVEQLSSRDARAEMPELVNTGATFVYEDVYAIAFDADDARTPARFSNAS